MNYSIYVESTPNPEVMKFVSNRMIADKSIEIKNLREAKGISIAEELLKFPFVKSIYLSANFISITKISEVSWEDIAMQLRIFISDHLNSNIIKNYTEGISANEKVSNRNADKSSKEFNKSEKEIRRKKNAKK